MHLSRRTPVAVVTAFVAVALAPSAAHARATMGTPIASASDLTTTQVQAMQTHCAVKRTPHRVRRGHRR